MCPGLLNHFNIDTGFEELGESRLPNLIDLKYHSMTDAAEALGGVDEIRNLFFNFQQYLYERQGEIKQLG